MTDMHPYEALKIALQEARDERDDWRESATRAAGESCGDERHCTCVGPLRKELRDAKAKLAALVEATIAMRDANIMANDYEWMSCREIDAKYGRVISLTDVANASSDARMKVDAALAAAKVQP